MNPDPDMIIDATVFAELKAATGDEFLSELIDTYCQETPQLIAALLAALVRQDADAFRREAHSIKSSSATFGALVFSGQARELEMIGRAGDLSCVGDGADRLAADYALVERALRELQHAA